MRAIPNSVSGIAAMLLALVSVTTAATPQYIPGVFAASKQGPVELISWAERTAAGRLRMVEGSLDDVPVLPDFFRAMISMPFWIPISVLVGNESAFRDDTPELLPLVFGGRQLNARASELRIASLEKPEKVAQLLKRVKATTDSPGYIFIVIGSDGRVRYYPFRIAPQPPS